MGRSSFDQSAPSSCRAALAHAEWDLQPVAGEAIGAAAKAATEVLLDKTSEALAEGHATLTRSSPAIQRTAEKTVRRSIDNPARSKRRKRTS